MIGWLSTSSEPHPGSAEGVYGATPADRATARRRPARHGHPAIVRSNAAGSTRALLASGDSQLAGSTPPRSHRYEVKLGCAVPRRQRSHPPRALSESSATTGNAVNGLRDGKSSPERASRVSGAATRGSVRSGPRPIPSSPRFDRRRPGGGQTSGWSDSEDARCRQLPSE